MLILGDVLNNIDVVTGIPGLHARKPFLTPDPARNTESARRLAALEPALVCFGHGRPLRDTDGSSTSSASCPADQSGSRAEPGAAASAASAALTSSHCRPIDSSVVRISHGFSPSAGRKSSAIPRA